MKKIIFYDKDTFNNLTHANKSPYFSVKTKVKTRTPFPEIPIGRKPGKEIFKEWKI